MDRWKSRWEESEKKEKKKEDQRRERVGRKNMQVGEKVEKSKSLRFSDNLWPRRVEKSAR